MIERVKSPRRLRGTVSPPGDKSISHRALLLNAVADGRAEIENLGTGADIGSTAACLHSLGVEIGEGVVHGVGLGGLRKPSGPLDCGNSGTTMRLLAGLLAGQPFESMLVGDESLARRPMDRVVEPLRKMGAHAELDPLRVGGRPLHGIEYSMPVVSAQVKSAILLAGLRATGTTRVVERVPTRDHTELMLEAMGAPLTVVDRTVSVETTDRLQPLDLRIPGDISGAAFWIVAGSFHPDASLEVLEVGVNPTRKAILELLPAKVMRLREVGREPVADLQVGTIPAAPAWDWDASWSAALIDELPVLAVAATQLRGTTRIAGAAELRVKESDRIAAMAKGLGAMGAQIREREDGWEITGPTVLTGARVSAFDDHRVAMALAVAGLLAGGTTEIEGAEHAAISYPNFWRDLESLC
ncbi:MAG: 3-phosphoshikimate 1-carboxyvinyltransferase [Chloroflexi bacterium]|nr:MAG: 3-phosphoshikimate 1-carboxyvinyltransferase [Chloroflexota bacterium]